MSAASSPHARLVALLGRSIAGRAVITEASSLGADEIVLTLTSEAGEGGAAVSSALHLLLVSPFPLFWLAEHDRGAPPSRSGFSDWMRRRLIGARITRAHAGESGKILRLDLEPARSEIDVDASAVAGGMPAAIVLDPLPNACRLLVLDRDGRVVQRYPPTLHGNPVGRGAPGGIYHEPAPPPDGLREAASRAPDRHEDTDETRVWVCATLRSSAGRPRPVVFLSSRACHAPDEAPFGREPYSWDDAARIAGRAAIRIARHERLARALRRILARERKHLEGLEKKLTAETGAAERGRLIRRQAEALLANPGRVPKGASHVSLDDPAAPGMKIEIDLDPRLNFSRNAALLFKQAARLERGLPQRAKRMEQARRLRAAIGDWMNAPALTDPWHPLRDAAALARGSHAGRAAGAPPSETAAELLKQARGLPSGLEAGLRQRWQRMIADWDAAIRAANAPEEPVGYEARRAAEEGAGEGRARAATAGGREADVSTIHPRSFELPGGWTVLVGRSNRENDILTHRLARPDDLWFHARGVTGSHVVLRRGARAGNPPREVIERTAAIAAFFSKGRTSAMVPVIYAEKRYVRKPRKGAPGLAVCTRETVIMVEPRLP